MPNGSSFRDKKDFRRNLITFATVSDALTASNDFFVGIAPIFATIATERAGQLFDAQTFCSDVRKEFGLSVPIDVAEHFVPRLLKTGLLERRGTEDIALFWKGQGKSDLQFHKDLDSKLDEIIQLFEDFVRSSNSIFAASYDEQKLGAILFDFLVSRDKRVSAATSVLYGVKTATDSTRFESEEEFVCARFLEKLEANRADLFQFLGNISNAAILSEVILELGEGRTSRDRKTELLAYVDAPLAMDAIGLSGPASKDYAETIITNLKKMGATIAIFDHSVEEIRDNLHGLLKADATNREGPTADAMRMGQVDPAFVALAKNNIEEFVEKNKSTDCL